MIFRQTVYRWLQTGATSSLDTASTYSRQMLPFIRWAEEKGLVVENTKAEDLTGFMRYAQDKLGWAGVTLDSRMSLVRRFYNWCIEEGLVKGNPAARRKLPTIIVADAQRVPFLEEQHERVLNVIRITADVADYWEPACIIGWHTGLRCSDVACLRWNQVSFDDGMIRVTPRKTRRLKKALEIPMTDELTEMLLTVKNRPVVGLRKQAAVDSCLEKLWPAANNEGAGETPTPPGISDDRAEVDASILGVRSQAGVPLLGQGSITCQSGPSDLNGLVSSTGLVRCASSPVANLEPDRQFVLPVMHEIYEHSRPVLPMEFRVICDAAGLPEHSFHSYRHGFVSRLLNQGVGHLVIASMTGHSLEQIETYAHVSADAKRAALGIMNRKKAIAV